MDTPPARKALAGLLVAAAVLGGTELLLRLWLPAPAEPSLELLTVGSTMADPDYGWRLEPGARVHDPVWQAWARRWGLDVGGEDQVSRHGFRDSELAEPRPPGQRRVLVLGDSSVWGSGVALEDRFSERLERALERDQVEVINGGTPGWSSYQSLQQLRDSLHLGLDALVVYSLNSDLMPAEGGLTDDAYFPARRSLRGASAMEGLALVRGLRMLLPRRRPTLGTTGRLRVSVGAYLDNLREFAAVAREHELGLVFVLPPNREDLDSLDDHYLDELEDPDTPAANGLSRVLPYRRAMVRAGREAGRPVVDSPSAFHRAQGTGRHAGAQALFVDEIHPSAQGHRLLAEAILPALQGELEAHRGRSSGPVPAWVGRARAVAASDRGAGERVDNGLVEVRCSGGSPGAEQIVVPVTVHAAKGEVLLTVLQPGADRASERVVAHCRGQSARLLLPRSLGRVRIVAVVDGDEDGPCFADLQGAAAETVDLSGEPAAVEVELGEAAEAGPWAAPYGLPYGAFPLLAWVREHQPRGTLAVVAAPGGAVDAADLARQLGRPLSEIAPQVRLVAISDLADPSLPKHSAWAIVAPLGSGLPDQVLEQASGRRAGGWTDPSGAGWTVVTR